MSLKIVFVLTGFLSSFTVMAAPNEAPKRGVLSAPFSKAVGTPVLSGLLNKAGWTSTPEMSGVFQVGRIFKVDGNGHSLMVRDCFDAEPGTDPYTSSEVVTQLQAGVRVKMGIKIEGSGTFEKRAKFDAPVHHTLERLAMVPTEQCSAMLASATQEDLSKMYAVQEVLTAVITEQTCGQIDASGRFVAAKADAEIGRSCSQKSLEPVAVAYRSVPVQELAIERKSDDIVPVSVASPIDDSLTGMPSDDEGCHWGAIETVHSTMSTMTINGQTFDVRGASNRAWIVTELQQCGHMEAARAFTSWRGLRRTTNISCATGVGCYPLCIGIVSALAAKKQRLRMEHAMLAKNVENAK